MSARSLMPQRGAVLRDVVGLAVSMVAALVGFVVVSGVRISDLPGLWGANDGVLEYAMAKVLSSGPGTMATAQLGFPVGQDWSHFPSLDPLTRAEAFVLTQITDPVTAMNLVIVLSFPLIAGAMYVALRNLMVQRFLAAVGGFAFSMIGYHFDYEHPILSNYYAVALGIVWLSLVMGTSSYVAKRGTTRVVLLVGVITGVFVGWQTPYYGVFFLILGGIAFVFRARSQPDGISTGVRLVILVTPAVALGASITITRLLRTVPSTEAAAQRTVEESFTWAGQLASLFTVSGSSLLARTPLNGALQEGLETTAWTGLGADHSALVVAASAAMALIALFLVFRDLRNSPDVLSVLADVRPWAGLWMVGAGFFVTSGLGVIFASLVTTQIRGWSRLAVIIAAIALTGGAVLLSRFLTRMRQSPGRASRLTVIGLMALIAALALDSLTNSRPVHADTQRLPELASLMSSPRAQGGGDCPILLLPIVSFPEAYPKGDMQGYDHLLPFLAGTTETFNYGAIFGQLGSRWTDHLSVAPAQLLPEVTALGFCAVIIDTAGLDETSPSLEQYEEILGTPLDVALNRWHLYSLENVTPDPTAADMFARPEVIYATGFTEGKMTEDAIIYRWITEQGGTLRVWNPASTSQGWVMEIRTSAPPCQPDQRLRLSVNSTEYSTSSLAGTDEASLHVPLRIPAQSYVDVSMVPELPACAVPDEPALVAARIEHPSFVAPTQDGIAFLATDGFLAQESNEKGDVWQWTTGEGGHLTFFNTTDVQVQARFTTEIQTPPCGSRSDTVVTVDGEARDALSLLPGDAKSISLDIDLPPMGQSEIALLSPQSGCSVGDDPRVLGPGLRNAQIESR